MTRVFAYCRVSTADQTTTNQCNEIAAAGFDVKPSRTIAETISGSVAASERKGFSALLGKLEDGDVLVVTKLDRLGRNAMDVRATVEALAGMGVRVHCLALGGVDLTSPAGKMTMQVIAAVADPPEQPLRHGQARPPCLVAVSKSENPECAGTAQRWSKQAERSRCAEDHPRRPEFTEQTDCPAGDPWRWQQQRPVANDRIRALTVRDYGAI